MWKTVRKQLQRVLRNWNVENRAFREIEKPRQASPRYPTEERVISKLFKEQQNIDKSAVPGLESTKDPSLDERLKHVKIASEADLTVPVVTNVEYDPRKRSSKRNLPQRRPQVIYDEFGYPELESVIPGRLTMKEAISILSTFQEQPDQFSIPEYAKKYSLNEGDLTAMIQHFGVFVLAVPKKGKEEPKVLRISSFFGMDKTEVEKVLLHGGDEELEAYKQGPYTHRKFLEEMKRGERKPVVSLEEQNEHAKQLKAAHDQPKNVEVPGDGERKS